VTADLNDLDAWHDAGPATDEIHPARVSELPERVNVSLLG